LPQLNSITVPPGIKEAEVRSRLLGDYNLEIGAGLGALAGKVWRIGLMGESSCKTNVLICLGALDAILSDMSAPINSGKAVAAAQAIYNKW
jgi:alanine-glyoxylate transaminase/serine-glyoxylate transaminase/serine-pyruvate transaminase